MKNSRGFSVIGLLSVLIALAGIGGWIANIVKIVSGDLGPLTGWLILRLAGIFFPPLGAVLGFL